MESNIFVYASSALFLAATLLTALLPQIVTADIRAPYHSPPSSPTEGLVVTSWEHMTQGDWGCVLPSGNSYADAPYPRDRYMIQWLDFTAKLQGDNSKTAWKVGKSHLFGTSVAKTALMYTFQ